MKTWNVILTLKELAGYLSSYKVDELPEDFLLIISGMTEEYENEIRELWEEFKEDPTERNAKIFIDKLEELAGDTFSSLFLQLVDRIQIGSDQKEFLKKAVDETQGYMRNSLLPDIIKAMKKETLDSLDYRVVILYAGALWSFGFLSTIMWDGVELRDLADLFIFAGPKDEETCSGDRGCDSHAGNIYTVAQILGEDIIPGRLKCLTNCRHMLIPIASPLVDPTEE